MSSIKFCGNLFSLLLCKYHKMSLILPLGLLSLKCLPSTFCRKKRANIFPRMTESFLGQSTDEPVKDILHFFDFQHFLWFFLRFHLFASIAHVFLRVVYILIKVFHVMIFIIIILNHLSDNSNVYVIFETCSNVCSVSWDYAFSCLLACQVVFCWKPNIIDGVNWPSWWGWLYG